MNASEWVTDKNKCPFLIVFASAATCLQAQRAVLLILLPPRISDLQRLSAACSPHEVVAASGITCCPKPSWATAPCTGTLITVFRYPYQGPEGCFCPSRAWKDTNCCQLLCGTILCKLIHFFFFVTSLPFLRAAQRDRDLKWMHMWPLQLEPHLPSFLASSVRELSQQTYHNFKSIQEQK